VSRVLSLRLGGSQASEVPISQAVIAGWTGRDPIAVEKHIKELEELGVKRPATTPIFYRVAAARLTTDDAIEAVGESSGGEVEFVLLQHAGRMWVGAGSDHTDREVEKYGVTVSKQLCEKPLAPLLWPLDEVAPHWDRLILRSHVVENGGRSLYQEGAVTAMMEPQALLARYGSGLPEGTLMFCGTLAAHGGVRPTAEFAFELEDPVRGRKIGHSYLVRVLPILG
jgi:biotin operon repressor